jgi:Tfp pilus assembly protein PilF
MTLTNPGNRAYYEQSAPRDSGSRFEAARIAYIQGRFDQAEGWLRQGMDEAPAVQAPFYLACLGLVAQARGDQSQAAREWNKALSLGGLNPAETQFIQNQLTKPR